MLGTLILIPFLYISIWQASLGAGCFILHRGLTVRPSRMISTSSRPRRLTPRRDDKWHLVSRTVPPGIMDILVGS